MRISDWSSDVCSSDLRHCPNGHTARRFARLGMVKRKVARRGFEMKWMAVVIAGSALLAQGGLATAKESALPPRECAAKAPDRKSVGEGKRESVRGDRGGSRSIQKKQQHIE